MEQRKYINILIAKAKQDIYVLDQFVNDPAASDEILGFHAQQAAEKLLKVLLVFAGVTYPRTHRLAELLDVVRKNNIYLPDTFDEVRYLTPFAVEFRYDLLPIESEEPLDRTFIHKLILELYSWVSKYTDVQD